MKTRIVIDVENAGGSLSDTDLRYVAARVAGMIEVEDVGADGPAFAQASRSYDPIAWSYAVEEVKP